MKKVWSILPLLLVLVTGCAVNQHAATTGPKPVRSLTTVELLSMLETHAQHFPVTPDFEVDGDSAAIWLPKLELAVTRRGLDVVYTGLAGMMGLTDGLTTVAIEKTQGVNSRASTLLHEYAHVLGCRGPLKPENEVCAESASYLAARQLGLDTRNQSFNYIILQIEYATVQRVLWRDQRKIAAIVSTMVSEVRQ